MEATVARFPKEVDAPALSSTGTPPTTTLASPDRRRPTVTSSVTATSSPPGSPVAGVRRGPPPDASSCRTTTPGTGVPSRSGPDLTPRTRGSTSGLLCCLGCPIKEECRTRQDPVAHYCTESLYKSKCYPLLNLICVRRQQLESSVFFSHSKVSYRVSDSGPTGQFMSVFL